jgi:WD40 repeat protein
MQAERDHLRTHIFPALEERLKARRRHLEWVDLRLGVATAGEADAEARELQVLKVCLAEVRRCRPFLIVLLGDRYGWVPPKERIAAAAAEEGIATDVKGRSVTDLEIRYGVLDDPGQQPRSYFYFREALPYGDMPREVAALYSDAHGSGGESRDRLAELKAEIQRTLPERVRRYSAAWNRQRSKVTGLEAWGQMVLEDIWSDLEAATASDDAREPISWQEAERLALHDHIEDRARDFVGRGPVLARLEALAQSAAQEGAAWGLVLTGAAGTGKSATFGALHRRLEASGAFVLAHAAGASPRAPSVNDMLRRWIDELAAALGTDAGLAENADPDTVDERFQSLLGRMALGRRVVVLIDALDQFEATTRGRFMTWLPRLWPENARLIATAIPGNASKALAERPGVESMPLPPLDAAEARRIAEGICARYHRTLEPEVLDTLLAKRGTDGPAWSNTLWLVLAVEELNLVDADDFARASRTYKGSAAERLRALMLDIVAALPTDIVGLYGATFERAEELYGHDFARAFLGAIAVSRGGWRESDFRVLLPRLGRPAEEPRPGLLGRLFRSRRPEAQPAGETWDELRFASLRRLFRGQVRQRGRLGQWDFNHAQMRAAALQRLAAHGLPKARFHAAAADHLLALPSDDPLHLSETMLHLMGSEDWSRAARFYGDPALTEPQIEGATRVLADTVLTADTDDQLHRVRRLLDAAAHPADADAATLSGGLAQRFLFNLDGILGQRASLGARGVLIRQAGELLDRLTKVNPGNVGWQRYLSFAHEKIGGVLAEQGNLPAALHAYQISLAIRERLAKAEPGNAAWQRILSVSYTKIGEVLFEQGNLSAALDAFQTAHEIAERLAKADPGNDELQRGLSVSHNKIGDVRAKQGSLSAAFDAFQSSLVIRQHLTNADPANSEWQRDLSVSHIKIGEALVKQGNLPAAHNAFQTSHEIFERLAGADPENAGRQHDLSLSHIKIGEVLVEQGNLPAAHKAFQTSREILERLAQRDTGNAEWQRHLSASEEKVRDVLRAQRNLPAVLSSYQASLALRERLAKVDPGNAQWQDDIAASHTSIGEVLVEQGNLPEALDAYQASLAIRDRLAKADPGNAELQRDLSAAQEKIGDVLVEHGNLTAALDAYQASLAIRDRLAKADPTNTRWQHDIWLAGLAISHSKIGLLLSRMNRPAEALAVLRKGRAIVRPLVERAPDHKLWNHYLAAFDHNIGRLERRIVEPAMLRKAFRLQDPARSGPIIAVAFSPDSCRMASANAFGALRLWEAASGSSRALEDHRHPVEAVAFSRDGERVVFGSASVSSPNALLLLEVGTGVSRTLEGHSSRVASLAFSPTGHHIVSGSWDHTLRLWDVTSGTSYPLEGHSDWVSAAAFSPDGRYVVSACTDRTLRLWEVASRVSRELKGHDREVTAVAFSPDGRRVVSGAADSTLRLWEVETGASRVLEGPEGPVEAVTFSPDGRHIVSTDGETLRLWEVDSRQEMSRFDGDARFRALAIAPDSRRLAAGDAGGSVYIFDILVNGADDKNPPDVMQRSAPRQSRFGFSYPQMGETGGLEKMGVNVYRVLAKRQPDTALPELARRLDYLGLRSANLWQGEEALSALREAADIYRTLASKQPEIFLSKLAKCLTNFGSKLSNLWHRDEAPAVSKEAVDIYRALAKDDPDAFLPELATSLGVLSKTLMAAGHHTEASDAARDGLVVIAPLVERSPESFGDLGRALAKAHLDASNRGAGQPDIDLVKRVARALGFRESAENEPRKTDDE